MKGYTGSKRAINGNSPR